MYPPFSAVSAECQRTYEETMRQKASHVSCLYIYTYVYTYAYTHTYIYEETMRQKASHVSCLVFIMI